MIAASTAAELRAEIGRLNLVEVADLTPGFVADSSRDINFELQNRQVIQPQGLKPDSNGTSDAALKGPLFHYNLQLCGNHRYSMK